MKIFTFWEPRSSIPGYISLCMKTWKVNLPESEIVILDYSNLRTYLDSDTYNEILFKEMSLAKQSDAIRAAVLRKHGGIWLDTDTIIIKPEFFDCYCKDSNVVMIGSPKTDGALYGAFIYASKPYTAFIQKWYEELPDRIRKYKKLKNNWLLRKLHRTDWKKAENWDYCINSIIDPLSKTMNLNELNVLDADALFALPERVVFNQIDTIAAYTKFYFSNNTDWKKVFNQSAGILLLHNSWTPEHFRKMTEKEFLKQDVALSNLLRKVLKC